jgi:uncharacterized delta-60 repeat protein
MIVIGGTAFAHAGVDQFLVARYRRDGVLDEAFGSGGSTTTSVGASAGTVSAVAVQPDGYIVVVGTAFSNGATDDDFALARYTPAGELDRHFGSSGVVTTDFSSRQAGARPSLDHASALAIQPDAKLLVGGFTRGDRQAFAVARYNHDGTLDVTFGRDGKVMVPGTEPQVFSIMLTDSGTIVLAGSAASGRQGTALFTLVRLRWDGSPDDTFGSGGVVSTMFEGSRSGARAVTAQPDGKLISAGAKLGAPSASGDPIPGSGFALARYNADGSVDTRFGSGGRVLANLGDAGATPVAVAVQPDGKIIVAGLVYFQVPSASARPFPAVEASAAGLFAIGILCVGVLMVRHLRRS